jgi:UPF0176 protein
MFLYNRVNKKILKERIQADTTPRTTLSFYRYVILSDLQQLRDELFLKWSQLGVLGRIYIAREGINAQMSVPTSNFDEWKNQLDSYSAFANMPLKIAVEDNGKSFYKLAIKVRNKIVADGLPDDTFDVTNVGRHLTAEEFNKALELPETIVVDLRNHYESEVGHFEGAILPDADTFREELPMVLEELKDKKDKKLLLYCTGGIRCEKASAYFKHHGFKDVNQLHGGIIAYAQEIKQKGLKSKFIGKNFVFDERLGERITDDIIATCHQCGKPCDNHTNCANDDCHLLFIQCDECKARYENCCSTKCQEIIHLPIEEQRKLRKGQVKNNSLAVYKSRLRPKLSPQVLLGMRANSSVQSE